MSNGSLKADNLKVLSTDSRRKVKKIKCYEMYIYYDDNNNVLEEQIIRELAPKIVKAKHFSRNWNSSLSIHSLNDTSNRESNIDTSIKPTKFNLIKSPLSKNKITTSITPISMIRTNDVRRSPNKYDYNHHYMQTVSRSTNKDDYYSFNKKHNRRFYSRMNDPVKITDSYKHAKHHRHGYGKYPKTFVKTLTELDPIEEFKNKPEIFKDLSTIPPSAIPYNNNNVQTIKSNLISSIMDDANKSNGETMSRDNCSKMQSFAKGFGIQNIQDWVRRNCTLAKMYMPNATCSQINHFVDSCYNQNLFT
uniref:Homeobox domain-containing protein n=1 Tax=Parastrongyloides trichosuri TaxID=131310 RepID=A0A0N4ZBE3_PARTI